MNYIGWLVLFVIFAVLELISLGLTSIWFAVGALAACITSLITDNWMIQAIVFIIVTVAVLIFLRPIAIKYINNRAEKTNIDSLIGKKVKVLEDIDNVNAKGKVFLNGMEWTARSAEGNLIKKDALVEVVEIEGVKVIVKEV